jgi:hypothetical protein
MQCVSKANSIMCSFGVKSEIKKAAALPVQDGICQGCFASIEVSSLSAAGLRQQGEVYGWHRQDDANTLRKVREEPTQPIDPREIWRRPMHLVDLF